jgi:transcription elongation GreA/GreB family factor
MSRAFVKERQEEVAALPDRPISDHPNLVTPEGLAAIESAVERFRAAYSAAFEKRNSAAEAAMARETRYWAARKRSARVVQPSADKTKVQFGATVTVMRKGGRTQTFRIVGEDEANPQRGTISYVSPFARAVLGKSLGDRIVIAGEEAEILEIK